MAQLTQAMPSFFLFAVTWSIGATCDIKGREAFDTFLRSKAAGGQPGIVLPVVCWCSLQQTLCSQDSNAAAATADTTLD